MADRANLTIAALMAMAIGPAPSPLPRRKFLLRNYSETPRLRLARWASEPDYMPPAPTTVALEPQAECLQIVQERGALLRHRVTGDVRKVTVWGNGDVDFAIGNRTVRRPARKALDWLRNADAAGGAA